MPVRLAVISGASSGIGRAAALLLSTRGFYVVLVARSLDKLEAVAADVHSRGGGCSIQALDAADGDAVLAMADRVRQLGEVAVLVNAAGAGTWHFIEETPPGQARKLMDAPYFAAYNLTHAFMQDMLEARRGTIIHVGSPASIVPWPGATAYTAARWALRGLHEALCQDLAGTGVRSCFIEFGEVASGYWEANPGTREQLPRIGRMIPPLSPEACARVIASVAQRPRRRVLRPRILWLLALLGCLLPALPRYLLRKTGRQRSFTEGQ